jgi:hypothetical protein
MAIGEFSAGTHAPAPITQKDSSSMKALILAAVALAIASSAAHAQ